MKLTFKNIPELISSKSYCVQGILFHLFLCMEEHKHTMSCTGGDQYFRNSLKGEELYPFCCSVSHIKWCSSQLPEGFALTHLLSSCILFSKLCPGSKAVHLRAGLQSSLKSTGISNMFWKLLYLIRAWGKIIHASLKSFGLSGLWIIPLLFSLHGKDCV